MREYGDKARREGMAFLPFVMETYGAFGKHALEILTDLDDDISHNGSQVGSMKWITFAYREETLWRWTKDVCWLVERPHGDLGPPKDSLTLSLFGVFVCCR